jgi:hypothetical protein
VTAKLTVAVFIVCLEGSLGSHPSDFMLRCVPGVVLLGDGVILLCRSSEDDVIRHMQPSTAWSDPTERSLQQ